MNCLPHHAPQMFSAFTRVPTKAQRLAEIDAMLRRLDKGTDGPHDTQIRRELTAERKTLTTTPRRTA